jgi:hypothetical protein
MPLSHTQENRSEESQISLKIPEYKFPFGPTTVYTHINTYAIKNQK